MYLLKIILTLSTIIPSLDCCCSRTVLHRKSINLYSGVELSMQTPAQYQQNEQQSEAPPQSPSPAQLTTGFDQTMIPYRNHHLHYDSDEESDEDDDDLKLNRSQRTDLQMEEERLEQSFEDDFRTRNNESVDEEEDPKKITDATTERRQVEDAQLELMNPIHIECVESFRLEFCLNGGQCFLFPILNHSLSSCECAEGYVGERCEAKSVEYIPQIRPPFVLAKAIVGPLLFGLAVIDILFLLFLLCKNCNRD